MGSPAYRFTELGWLQFERLCMELLERRAGVPAADWKRHDDGLVSSFVEGELSHPQSGKVLPGPVCVIVSWWRPRTTNRRVHFDRVIQQAAAIPYEYGPGPMRALLLTNIEADGLPAWGPGDAAQVIDADGLSAIVDADPGLRRSLPSVLGVRDELDSLVPAELLDRSTLDYPAARALAPIFVPTPAHAQALAVLQRHGFAVLTGPPEMGKTAIARMVGLAQLTDGWEAHECVRPSELWDRFRRDRKQVFIADDAFGSTEYQPESAERWARELDGILRAMDDRHWLIWTSRPAPLKAGLRRVHRERGTERFPQPAEVYVSAAALDVRDKALILFRHARAAELDTAAVDLVAACGERVVRHPHFTPERIRRFVGGRLPELAHADVTDEDAIRAAVEEEIQQPTTAMRASFDALATEHRALLVAILDTPPGPVEEREVVASTRRHSRTGLPRPPSELIDRLTDHFLRIVPPTSVTWVHPSWRDLVIDRLRDDEEARRAFLARCEIHGVALALSAEGGAAGERVFPLLVTDRDWDALTDRILELLPDLEDFELFRLLSAIAEVPRSGADEHATREFAALRRTIVDSVRDRWDELGEPIPIALLDAWCDSAARLDPRPPPPALAATWIEVLPVGPIDVGSAPDLERWEDWIALVRTVTAYREAELEQFGYPQGQLDAVADLLSRARRLAHEGADMGDHERLGRVVDQVLRLPALLPDLDLGYDLYALARGTSDAGDPPTYESTEPRAFESGASIVDRILRDLRASRATEA